MFYEGFITMLLKGNFSVKFIAKGVEFREEYELAYRTEEQVYWSKNMLNTHSTLYQNALERISRDIGVNYCNKRDGWKMKKIMCELGWSLRGIEIVEINEIHNHLIVEES